MLQNASLLENNSLTVNLYLNLNLAERLSLCPSKKDEGSKISFNLLVVKFQADWDSLEIVTLGSVARAKPL